MGRRPEARNFGVTACVRRARSVLAVLLLVACTGAPDRHGLPPWPPTGVSSHIVHVVRGGWHSGIVVPRAHVLASELGDLRGLPAGDWLEFGWGDRDYFTAPDPDLAMALAAGFASTASVVHVVGRAEPPAVDGTPGRALAIPLGYDGIARLTAGIAASLDRSGPDGNAPLPDGASIAGAFYAARGRFHLFNTCNTWVAARLAAAGVPLSPTGLVTADDLMSRLRDALASAADAQRRP